MPKHRYKVTIYTTTTGEERGIPKLPDSFEEKTIQMVCDDCGRLIKGMFMSESEYQRLLEEQAHFRCTRKSCDD